MKKILPVLRPIVLILIGSVLALLSAALSSEPSSAIPKRSLVADGQLLQITATATPAQGVSTIGSTDGIVLMGIIIVLIVLMPILLRRKSSAI